MAATCSCAAHTLLGTQNTRSHYPTPHTCATKRTVILRVIVFFVLVAVAARGSAGVAALFLGVVALLGLGLDKARLGLLLLAPLLLFLAQPSLLLLAGAARAALVAVVAAALAVAALVVAALGLAAAAALLVVDRSGDRTARLEVGSAQTRVVGRHSVFSCRHGWAHVWFERARRKLNARFNSFFPSPARPFAGSRRKK